MVHSSVRTEPSKIPNKEERYHQQGENGISLAPEGSWQGEHDLTVTISITPEPPALAAHRRQQATLSRPGEAPAHVAMRPNHWDNAQVGSRSCLVSISPGTQNPAQDNHRPRVGAALG